MDYTTMGHPVLVKATSNEEYIRLKHYATPIPALYFGQATLMVLSKVSLLTFPT